MTDLVKRLRERVNDSPLHAEYMMDEAADRIAALEAEVARWKSAWRDSEEKYERTYTALTAMTENADRLAEIARDVGNRRIAWSDVQSALAAHAKLKEGR